MHMKCLVEDCQQQHKTKGYCNAHYRRLLRNGTHEYKYVRDGKSKERSPLRKKKWRSAHPFSAIFSSIKGSAISRNKAWSLTQQDVIKFVMQPCVYCGRIPISHKDRNGIDRIDNSRGYIFDNCASCCRTCNNAKGTLTIEEFKVWIRRIFHHQQL